MSIITSNTFIARTRRRRRRRKKKIPTNYVRFMILLVTFLGPLSLAIVHGHAVEDGEDEESITLSVSTTATTTTTIYDTHEPSSPSLTRDMVDDTIQKVQHHNEQQFPTDDTLDDGIFDPFAADPSCATSPTASDGSANDSECWQPPESTIETTLMEVSCSFGGEDPSSKNNTHDDDNEEEDDEGICSPTDDDDFDDNDDENTSENGGFDKDVRTTDKRKKKKRNITKKKVVVVDKHWGSDQNILRMRDKLRRAGTGVSPVEERRKRRNNSDNDQNTNTHKTSDTHSTTKNNKIPETPNVKSNYNNNNNNSHNQHNHQGGSQKPHDNRRPPVILMPGLASTRLVSWKFKSCGHPLLSDIKVQDYVWLNINQLVQMGTINSDCWAACITLGQNQTDMDDSSMGCKLRPDEGLDAISSLAPGSVGSNLLVGSTNTVYAWLIQWLADNLGYDVSSIVGLPYDWRLSPDIMEKRDGFLTLTRLRIEAAVKTNKAPAVMVAHSMGNVVFRYFLEWLKHELKEEAYVRLVKRAEKRAKVKQYSQSAGGGAAAATTTGWMGIMSSGFDDVLSYFTEPENNTDENDKDGSSTTNNNEQGDERPHPKLWQLAKIEGENSYIEWLETHIWTYVGLSAPLLGAVNPLRAVISGENMGLPITDEVARGLELSFGSTHTVNPISSKMGFCDDWDSDDWGDDVTEDLQKDKANLACLDDIMNDIENNFRGDPWKDFPQLGHFLKDRVDWDTDFPMISILRDQCKTLTTDGSGDDNDNKSGSKSETCELISNIGPRDAQSGALWKTFSNTWQEEEDPLGIKHDQLDESFWSTPVRNILNHTWDRPHIKHVIMSYGVDVPTEAGYVYRKKEKMPVETPAPSASDGDKKSSKDVTTDKKKKYDGIPKLEKVIWEEADGRLTEELLISVKGKSLADAMLKKKVKKQPLNGGDGKGTLLHSGDGTIPYVSLSWAHTWLLHATRAMMHSGHGGGGHHKQQKNPLDSIKVTHRPKGGNEWISGAPPPKKKGEDEDTSEADDDTGTSHPHGTKYKPLMVKYHNVGTSRTTGMEYSTSLIEAIGVEHKETTRNYDILAAVFADVLKNMHDDFPELV